MAMITIGGTALPNPVSFAPAQGDIDSENSKRSDSGVLKRERIRAAVKRFEAEWVVTLAQYQQIVNAVSPASFSCTFFDPASGGTVTKTMYAGEPQGQCKWYPSQAKASESLWSLKIPFIEY